MAKISTTPFAECCRAIGISQAEASALLVEEGFPSSLAQSLSSGRQAMPDEVYQILCSLWKSVDEASGSLHGLDSAERRQLTIINMRFREWKDFT